jgi:hypothetical protein
MKSSSVTSPAERPTAYGKSTFGLKIRLHISRIDPHTNPVSKSNAYVITFLNNAMYYLPPSVTTAIIDMIPICKSKQSNSACSTLSRIGMLQSCKLATLRFPDV